MWAEKEFAAKCTVTQLVQAVAYPLAVITNGTRGGWIDPTSGQDWTTRVLDTSFCAQYSIGAVGLLDAVRQRCDASGELQAFRTIVGDGTRWAAMLASVSRTAWTGANSGIKKAFAFRRVLLSQELLASAEAGRMSSLITNIERPSGRSLVLKLARDASAILTELEQYLAVHWDDLIKSDRSPASWRMFPETPSLIGREGESSSWNRPGTSTKPNFVSTARTGLARPGLNPAST